MSFSEWLNTAKRTDDPVGDFVHDARAYGEPYPDFSRVKSLRGLTRVMGPHACDACMEILPDVWKRYLKWESTRERQQTRTASQAPRDAGLGP